MEPPHGLTGVLPRACRQPDHHRRAASFARLDAHHPFVALDRVQRERQAEPCPLVRSGYADCAEPRHEARGNSTSLVDDAPLVIPVHIRPRRDPYRAAMRARMKRVRAHVVECLGKLSEVTQECAPRTIVGQLYAAGLRLWTEAIEHGSNDVRDAYVPPDGRPLLRRTC